MENNTFEMPSTIGGASGAIKLNPNLARDSATVSGTNPNNQTKSKNSCC